MIQQGLNLTKLETPSDLQTNADELDQGASLHNPWRGLNRSQKFFENDEISSLINRGLFYARTGVPIHFQGAAGRGKTSIAMEIARRLGRRVSVMTGHDWLDTKDMFGREVGQTESAVVDKYIQSVRRSETKTRLDWEDSLLVRCMRDGHTLIYDEFTRASPEANGILLSVLEEGVLICTDPVARQQVIEAHPQFRVILTSNPGEYAGVNAAPDALLDRMITFPLSAFSGDTEAGIVSARCGLDLAFSRVLVTLVHRLLEDRQHAGDRSMRASILIGQICAARQKRAPLSDALLSQIIADVLNGRGVTLGTAQIAELLAQTPSLRLETQT